LFEPKHSEDTLTEFKHNPDLDKYDKRSCTLRNA